MVRGQGPGYCGGSFQFVSGSTNYNGRCRSCGGSAQTASYSCSYCGTIKYRYDCSNCGYSYLPYLSSCDARAKCSKCKGSTKETVNKVCPACSAGKVDCGICSGTGKIPHTVCSSTGHLTEWHNCQAHNIKDEHYYCTSNSYHGDNVSQYHK
ncbi:MAG: hypothetical protein HFJ38_08665 [Bacilli bacterium]|nr:hypothetical protein [Bacilli bacterium]